MGKKMMQQIIIFFILLCICAGCGERDEKVPESTVDTELGQEKTEGVYDNADTGQETESAVDLTTEEKEYEEYTAQWNFEKASLKVSEKNGSICYVRYIAAEGVADGEMIPYEQTDFAQDCKGGYDYMEAIYQWEPTSAGSGSAGVSDTEETNARYHPYDDGYNAGYTEEFVKEYLKKQGIKKTEPDGVLYNREGEMLVEYYIEEAENKYCFIVHMWGNYLTDFEKGIREYQDAIFCTTHILKESDRVGTFLYNVDYENEIIRERMYDAEGMNRADISYENKPNEPVAPVTDYWYLESGYDPGKSVLCRGQKFWFAKTQIETGTEADDTDETGELADDAFYSGSCTFSYDGEGRITLVEEALIEGEAEGLENSGWAEFHYDENGILKQAEYWRSSRTQGTTDSEGRIEYDQKGRMIYNDFYITHGRDADIYLYEEDADLPWACLNWCSFAPGIIKVTLFERI